MPVFLYAFIKKLNAGECGASALGPESSETIRKVGVLKITLYLCDLLIYKHLIKHFLSEYNIIFLKNNSKFFIKFGFLRFRYLTSSCVRFNSESLTLVRFLNAGF